MNQENSNKNKCIQFKELKQLQLVLFVIVDY